MASAKRYTQKQKDEVVSFVVAHNKKHGRGGQAAANAKFGINPISIASWLDKAGVKTPGKKRTGKKRGPRKGSRRKASPKGSSVTDVLARMQAIQKEIDSLQKEFEQLKTKI